MAEISVIISVYNAENTVESCVYSVIDQTYCNTEIIIVDYGSADQSFEICKKIALSDQRIKLYKLENKGLAYAKNFGLKVASGRYVCFADSGDYLGTKALEFMHNKACNSGCDIVLCGYYKESFFRFTENRISNSTVSGKDVRGLFKELEDKNLIDPVFNKLYRRDFLSETGVLMPEGEICEDTEFNLRLLAYDPQITLCSECFYYHCRNRGSITNEYSPEKLQVLKKRTDRMRTLGITDSGYCDYYYIRSVFSAITDMFLCVGESTIRSVISEEIKSTYYIKASSGAEHRGIFHKAFIGIAMSMNTGFIYAFCRLCHIFKYKLFR